MNARSKGWIYVVVQFLILGLILFSCFIEKKYVDRPYTYTGDLIAFILLSAGALIFLISLMNFGSIVTPNPVPMRGTDLKTNGLYSRIRHPIYLSVLLITLGCIFFFAAFYSLLLYLVLIIFFVIKMNFEEEQLKEKFQQYSEYCKFTKRLIPYIY